MSNTPSPTGNKAANTAPVSGSEPGLLALVELFLKNGMHERHGKHDFAVAFKRAFFRAKLAEKIKIAELLAPLRTVPKDVVALLCCDKIEVASIMLAHSPLLDDAELTTQILQGNMSHRRAIAEREDLNTVLISHLLVFGEAPVAQKLQRFTEAMPGLSHRIQDIMARGHGARGDLAGQQSMTQQKNKPDTSSVGTSEQPETRFLEPDLASDRLANISKALDGGHHGASGNHMETRFSVSAAPTFENSKPAEGHSSDPMDDLEDLSDEELESRFALGAFDDFEDEGEKSQRRLSFRIGAEDDNTAPIPPLEPDVGSDRAATIAFGGRPIEDVSPDSPSIADEDTELSYSATRPEADRIIASGIADHSEQAKVEADVSATAAVDNFAEAPLPSEPNKDTAPTIRLTVRKKNHAVVDQAPDEATSQQSQSVTLSSATEDDWESALARLSEEFETQPERTQPTQVAASEPLETAIENSIPQSQEPFVPASVAEQSVSGLVDALPPQLPSSLSNQSMGENVETIPHEHAPMGFMPDMVSFEGLDLVEAEPDLPSATELLLKQRATPAVELVEPVEVRFSDGSLSSAMADQGQQNLMKTVSEQLAAEKVTREGLPGGMEDTDINAVTHSVLNSEASNKTNPVSDPIARQGDMTDLAALSEHQKVDVDEYLALKKEENPSEIEKEPVVKAGPVQPLLADIAGGQKGAADTFFGLEAEARLDLLQAVLATSLADQALLHQEQALLPEEQAQELITARFGNDRIRLIEMLHDITGHRRMDLTGLLQDKGGEALVVYLHHLGLDESRTLSFVLHGPDAVSHDYGKVAQLMTLYDQLYPAASAAIVSQLFGTTRPMGNQAVHQPIHDDGAAESSPRLRDGETSRQSGGSASVRPVFGRRISNQS